MKLIVVTAILSSMSLFVSAQNIVYSAGGVKTAYTAEKIDIHFIDPPKLASDTTSNARFGSQQRLVAGLADILPTVVDLIFKTTTSLLEKQLKKFTAEYSKQQSNLNAGNMFAPDFDFIRMVSFGTDAAKTAFKLSFVARKLSGQPLFYYYVKGISLNYSGAKSTKTSNIFDYTVEMKVTLLVKGKKQLVALAPITISSVKYGELHFDEPENRTELIPMPEGALLTDVALKITETNPAKVSAQKILDTWNNQKDGIRTVINNYVPEAKSTVSGSSKKTDSTASKPVPTTAPVNSSDSTSSDDPK